MLDSNLIITLVTVVLAGLVRGFSGFGSGMILVPVLSMLYSPLHAVVTVTLLELIPSIQLMPKSIKHCHWNSIIPMAIMATLFVPFGVYILMNTDANIMRLSIAILIVISVAILSLGIRYKNIEKNRKLTLVTGVLSGLFNGAAGIGGLPVILFYLSSTFTSRVNRSSVIVYLAIVSFIAVTTYLYRGVLTVDIFYFVLLLIPAFITSVWFGGKMFGKTSESFFRCATLTLIGCIGMTMFYHSI